MNPESPNELAKAYDPSAIEEKWARYWADEKLFDVPAGEPLPGGAGAFTMLLPPPNVTGFLHMGHMFEHAESDILIRWHRMKGDRALWIPGTDHAGIATQMLVERALVAEGTTRQAMGREAFTARVWEWKRQYGGAITRQMRRLGASVDWSREYFTMDDRLSKAVVEAFVRLHEQGLVYRGAYIVNWDPVLQTAVSDLEVESEEQIGTLYHIRYPLADGSGWITIATTRPETMLGDTAVAVNPADQRYQHLIGKNVELPLSGIYGGANRQIPIIADEWAKPGFGTGAVKVTPAHDPNDFEIGQRHALPSINVFDQTGNIDVPGSPFDQQGRFLARDLIRDELHRLGLLESVKDHPMTVPVSQRTRSVIEPRLSNQWFVKIQPLAEKAIEAVKTGAIKITPEMYEKTYHEWMANIHDWCVSRQLWWGHRIPAWYCGNCKAINVARTAPAVCGTCGSAELTQETDVLDTWFSSGLLPFTVFGWPEEEGSGLRAQGSERPGSLSPEPWALSPGAADYTFYPTNLLVTGFDILFFWVARMIMLGTHFMLDVPLPDGSARTLTEAVPFREVYIHGLIRDANREKMSKTKGNVIDPIDIINRFGTDAVRFTLAAQASPGSDIAFNEARTEGYRAFANKIWNAARFLFMNLDRATEGGIRPTMILAAPSSTTASSSSGVGIGEADFSSAFETAGQTIEARWILSSLADTCAAVDKSLAGYRFDEAAASIYRFFWNDLCDWYLELIKLRLNFDEGANPARTEAALNTLIAVYDAALRLLSPFMPFITEEIWHALYAKLNLAAPSKSIALARYPQPGDYPSDPDAERDMALLQELIVTIRGLRKEMQVPEKEATPIRFFAADPATAALGAANQDMLAKMARVSSVEASAASLTGEGTRSTPSFDVQVVYERQIDVAAERERLTKDLAKYRKGLDGANSKLSNESFTAKAPAPIIEGLRKQAADTQLLYDKTKAALDALPPA